MAVVSLYMSDRDTSKTFTDKKEADNYDKMLELAENVSLWVENKIEGLTEEQTEALGLLVAENKDLLIRAFKKPELLNQSEEEMSDENVTPIAASGA